MDSRKQHDTAVPLELRLLDQDGPVSLVTAQTVYLIVKNVRTHVVQIHALMTINADQVGAGKGRVSYQWLALDVAAVGTFNVEVQVNWQDGTQLTFPNAGYDRFEIVADLDGA